MADKEFRIDYETKYDGQGADAAIRDAERANQEAKESARRTKEQADETVTLRDRLRGMVDAYREARKEGEGYFSSALAGIRAFPAAFAAATTAALGFLKVLNYIRASLNEFGVGESKVNQLDAALASVGKLTDEYRAKLHELAREFSEMSGIPVNEWLTAFALTVRRNPEDIEKEIEAVKNLAGIMGGDLVGAVAALTSAQAGEVESLKRVGLQFDQNMTKAEQLQSVYEQLAERGMGLLEAQSGTLAESFDKVRNAKTRLRAAIGGVIERTGILQGINARLESTILKVAEALGEQVDRMEGMRNIAPETADAVQELSDAMARLEPGAIEDLKRTWGQTADEIDRAKRHTEELAKAGLNLRIQEIRLAGLQAGKDPETIEGEVAAAREGARGRYVSEARTALQNRIEELTKNIELLRRVVEQAPTAGVRNQAQATLDANIAARQEAANQLGVLNIQDQADSTAYQADRLSAQREAARRRNQERRRRFREVRGAAAARVSDLAGDIDDSADLAGDAEGAKQALSAQARALRELAEAIKRDETGELLRIVVRIIQTMQADQRGMVRRLILLEQQSRNGRS